MGTNTTEIRTGRHCVFALHAHLVFVTKYRRNVFRAEHLDAIERILRAVCADFGAELCEFNGESDHVHLLVTYPPKVALASLVNSLKGVSSRLLRRDFPDLERRYWRGHLWSASYFAGSVGGAPLEVVRRYIEQQRRPFGPSGASPPA
jgi:putative transposase